MLLCAHRLAPLRPAAPRSRGRRPATFAASASSSSWEASARPVALPSGTLWLLNAMQDMYYNVHGQQFVIPRVEHREKGGPPARARFVRPKNLPARRPDAADASHAAASGGGGGAGCLDLIRQAVAAQPTALTLVSDGPLVDVEVEAGEPDAAAAADVEVAEVPPLGTACTGIVHVPSAGEEDAGGEADADLFTSSTTSPRRTKMLRFTCLADGCRAVNVKPISPTSFNQGTIFAQCAKCQHWHLIKDHLGLWDQSRRPVYDKLGRRRPARPPPPPLRAEDLPEALRPRAEDVDFYGGGQGRVSGWAHKW